MNNRRLMLLLPLLLFAVMIQADNEIFSGMTWRYGASSYSAPLSYYSYECSLTVNDTKELRGKTYQQLAFRMNANGSRREATLMEASLYPFPQDGELIGIRYENGRMLVDKEAYLALLTDGSYWSAWGTATDLPYETTADGELVLYDFTKSEGEVYCQLADGPITVTKVVTLKTQDGVSRRCLTLSNGLELVEGIGCINSPGMLLFWLNVQKNIQYYLTVGAMLSCSTTDGYLLRQDWDTYIHKYNGDKIDLLTEGRRWVYNYDNGQMQGTLTYVIDGDTIVQGYRGKKLSLTLTDKESNKVLRSEYAGALFAASIDGLSGLYYQAPGTATPKNLYNCVWNDYKTGIVVRDDELGIRRISVGYDQINVAGKQAYRILVVTKDVKNNKPLPIDRDSLCYWVNGIGSSRGLLENMAGALADSIQFVVCYDGDECIFRNEDFYSDVNPTFDYSETRDLGNYTHYIDMGKRMTTLVKWIGEEQPKGEVALPEKIEVWGFPCAVKELGEELFKAQKEITSVILPSTLETIGKSALRDCENITTIQLPQNLQSIELAAFYGSGLTTISIPAGVTTVAKSAFQNCSNLKDVYCWATTLPTAGNYVFRDIAADATLHVPAEALEAYQSTYPWNEINHIVAINEAESITHHLSPITQHPSALYDLQGRKVTGTATRGIYVKDGKKVVVK